MVQWSFPILSYSIVLLERRNTLKKKREPGIDSSETLELCTITVLMKALFSKTSTAYSNKCDLLETSPPLT